MDLERAERKRRSATFTIRAAKMALLSVLSVCLCLVFFLFVNAYAKLLNRQRYHHEFFMASSWSKGWTSSKMAIVIGVRG